MTPLLWAISAYIVAQLGIGIWVSRRIRTEDDYLVAGRSLGPVLTTFTVFATWFGAETTISAAGSVYESGLAGASAEPFGYALCIVLAGLLLAAPLWRLKLTTLADLFRIRFDVSVERVAVLLLVPTSLFWAAAQIRAFGQVLSAASGFEIEATITIAAAVVIAYTIVGGLLADAWTDLVQGIALILGLGAISVSVLMQGGVDFGALALDRTASGGGVSPSWLALAEEWAVPVIGSLVAAEVVARMIAARSEAVARNATVVAGLAYLTIGLMPVALGLAGAALLPGLAEPEQIVPLLAEQYLPTFLYVVFAGALVSAILSTVDSALLVAAGMVSHNIFVPLNPGLSERGKVRLARIAVALFGVVAYLMAFRAERVYDLVAEASAFGSAGVVTVVLFGLFTKVGGPKSALTALVMGVVTWVVGAHMLELPYPYLTSLAMASGSYVLVAAVSTEAAPTLTAGEGHAV